MTHLAANWPIIALAAITIALFAMPFLMVRRHNSETEINDAPEAEADRRAFRRHLGGWDK